MAQLYKIVKGHMTVSADDIHLTKTDNRICSNHLHKFHTKKGIRLQTQKLCHRYEQIGVEKPPCLSCSGIHARELQGPADWT